MSGTVSSGDEGVGPSDLFNSLPKDVKTVKIFIRLSEHESAGLYVILESLGTFYKHNIPLTRKYGRFGK